MRSRKSSGVIDLRGGRAKRVPEGQQPLFSLRPSRAKQTPRRPLPLRARRRRMNALIILGIVLLIAAYAYGVSWLSYLPQLSVNSISVVGAQQVQPQLVSAYAQTLLNDGSYHFLSLSNIFLSPREVLAEAVQG